MPRTFFGSGFFGPVSAPPDAYLALVAIFGNEAAADAWLDDWIAYAGDGATSEDLLNALESVGVPASAINVLLAAPASLSTDLTVELDTPAALAYAAPAAPLAGMPARATDLT